MRIPGEPRIVASLVLDMETGVVLAASVAGHEEQVLGQACEMALLRPAGGLAQVRPDHVLCNPGLTSLLKAQLAKMSLAAPLPPISEVPTVHEAEDIFDSFVGHMAGRRDAEEFAARATGSCSSTTSSASTSARSGAGGQTMWTC